MIQHGEGTKSDNTYHLFTIYYVLEIVLSPLHKLLYLIHITTHEVTTAF